MSMNEFTIHACEQVLRFSRDTTWSDLSEERKVQLGFNMGVMALGLELTKEDGFLALASVREGVTSMQSFHSHVRQLVATHSVPVQEENILRPF